MIRPGPGVEQPQRRLDLEQRGDQRDLREHRDQQRHRDDRRLAGEVEPGDGVGGHRAEHDGHEGGDEADADRVDQRPEEVGVGEDRRVALPGRRGREVLAVVERRVVLQRQRDDPDHRDEGVEQDEDVDAPPHQLALRGLGLHDYLLPPASDPGAAAPKSLDEQEGDDPGGDEDQHRHRRTDAEVEPPDEVAVGEHRHRAGLVRPAGQDEDVVEHPERVQGAEQQRHQDGRLDQRHGDHPEPLPRVRAVHRGGLEQVLGHQGQTRPSAAAP